MPQESNILQGYRTAFDLATAQFGESDPQALAERCGGKFLKEENSIEIPYLGQTHTVRWPSGVVEKIGSADEVHIATKVLLLNYVLGASARPTGELIAFRDLPGEGFYEPSFHKRAVDPLVRTFDGKPDLLYAAAERLGGVRASVADASVTIPVLPLLPVTYAIWHGDEEFPASGTILFDSSARRLLSVECLIVAASNGVYEMMKLARTLRL